MQQGQNKETYSDDFNFSDTLDTYKFDLLSFPFQKEIDDYPIYEYDNPIFKLIFLFNEGNVEKVKGRKSTPLFKLKGKRGRQIYSLKVKKGIHDRNTSDNILRKVQTHFITFILMFLNDLLKKLNINKKFLKLDYKLKKIIKKDDLEILKKKTLGEIISDKISRKYRQKNEDYNKQLCEEIKKNNILLSNIFSIKYITLFKKIYYKSLETFNLNLFGFDCDKEITLSNDVKMYKDLLNDSQRDKNKEYAKKVQKCVWGKFFPEFIFKIED